MDEPTAALALKEVGKVLDHKSCGHGVASSHLHRMDDIFIRDRVMALYQGNFAESRRGDQRNG
jgi:simple sugar transport system ATP-binding protein